MPNLAETIRLYLEKEYSQLDISVTVDDRNIVFISGSCGSWEEMNKLCHEVAMHEGVRSLVNDIRVNGMVYKHIDYAPDMERGKAIGVIDDVDVTIVGGGVIGCAVARELSRYALKIALLERNEDVATEASKANNGDIHSGYMEKPGSLKAKLNVKGNAMYSDWAKELNFKFVRKGNLLVLNDEAFMDDIEYVKDLANKNGVPFICLTPEELDEMEPIFKQAEVPPVMALYVPSTGNVDPWEVTIALAENAVKNGCRIYLDCQVCGVERDGGRVSSVITSKGIIKTNYLINCAGVYADDISEMAGDRCFTIHPRKGTVAICDSNEPAYGRMTRIVDKTRRIRNNKNTKGGGMATTVSGNNLMGPSAHEVQDKEDSETSKEGLDMAFARNSISGLKPSSIIRFFSGTRPATYTEDFYICASEKTGGLINVAGIQSPGLAAAPAIAEMAINILLSEMEKTGEIPTLRPDFDPNREAHVVFRELSRDEQDRLIKENPAYGRIVCRCESITEGEILDALRSPLIPTSVDAIKRRTRAGMGRCQGGFCQPRVLEIIARELGLSWTDVTLKGQHSEILKKGNRGG